MSQYPRTFQRLIEHFSKLPSIGPKAAERMVLYLFKQDTELLTDFAESLEALESLSQCPECFHISERDLCGICADTTRDQSTLCVVEEPLDVIAFERGGVFRGRYHVLGGVLDQNPRNKQSVTLKVPELLKRCQEESIREVIIATNPTTEGDLTALYLKEELASLPLVVTRIARGMATGGDIEYADEVTLKASLEHRETL